MGDLQDLYLKPGEERRLRAGHLWVFSNEVDTARTPLSAFAAGDAARLCEHSGRPLGVADVNPHSLICARLVARGARARAPGAGILRQRLDAALALRERVYTEPCYRLVHGEADGLPGLVVDRFGDAAVVQLNTAGMERRRETLIAAVREVTGVKTLLLRCDSPVRALEGLDRYVEWADDDGPDTLHVRENGAEFELPAATGQKTGWYYDHAHNRGRLLPLMGGARVLDLYSYIGAWGIQAAVAGAREVLAVESSADAVAWARHNAERNGVAACVHAEPGDVLEVLAALRAERRQFDVVIADPPAFIKRRKDVRRGLAAYQRVNRAAMQVLAPGGLLVSASCSAHLEEGAFARALQASARHLDRTLQIVMRGDQGPDHPVHGAIPETRYIKLLAGRLLLATASP